MPEGDAAAQEPVNAGRDERGTAGKLARALWLDGEIRAGRFPSVAELMEEFEVARRTAFNTLDYLRDTLGAPLVYSRERRGYYYSDPAFGLPAVFLREGELLAMLLADQVARQYLGTPLEQPLRDAISKLSRHLPERVQVELREVAQSFHFAGGVSVELPLALVAELQLAIREQRLLRIRYYTAGRDETTEREVEPHFLTNVRGDWMLVAWDRMRAADRVFMLARIREWRVLEARFRPRPELAPERYSRDTFLTEHGEAVQEVVLRFDSYQARWIRERVWHPSQQLEEQSDGSLLLRLRVAGEGDLLRWILGYGFHVEALAPAELRARVAETVRRTSGLYEEQR
ncbi:MAG: helix-turn-helix transcriptional regulator [Armatimonadota bacterium]